MVFCDVSVFNLLARCQFHHSFPAFYKNNENKNKREYNLRFPQVEHGLFTPLAFSYFEGMGKECNCFFSQTDGELFANQRKEP